MDARSYADAIKKFRPDDLTLFSSPHWHVLLRVKQLTLGSMILLPMEPRDDFERLTPDEANDLFQTVARAQHVLKDAFGPSRFNLIAAMMKDNFVHFHLIPRYESAKSFAQLEWIDADWPGLVTFRDVNTPQDALKMLVETLRISFNS